MMVLPAIGGQWLDTRRGTNYWSFIGLVLGVSVGLWQLLQLAGVGSRRPSNSDPKRPKPPKPDSNPSSDSIDAQRASDREPPP